MFDFSNATVEGNKYLQPGVHTVRVKEITDGVIESTGGKFLEFTIEDKTGAEAKHRYFLNNELKPGATKTAWDISRNAILQIVTSALNTDTDSAKAKLMEVAASAQNPAQLAAGLSRILAGKGFDIRLNGKEVQAKEAGKTNPVFSEFGTGTFTAPAGSNKLVFDSAKHIKRLTAPAQSAIHTSGTAEW